MMNSHGLVHRDLTADCVLLVPDTGPTTNKLANVKIAGFAPLLSACSLTQVCTRWAIPHLTRNGRLTGFGIGHPSTMAPEVLQEGPATADGLSWNPKVPCS